MSKRSRFNTEIERQALFGAGKIRWSPNPLQQTPIKEVGDFYLKINADAGSNHAGGVIITLVLMEKKKVRWVYTMFTEPDEEGTRAAKEFIEEYGFNHLLDNRGPFPYKDALKKNLSQNTERIRKNIKRTHDKWDLEDERWKTENPNEKGYKRAAKIPKWMQD